MNGRTRHAPVAFAAALLIAPLFVLNAAAASATKPNIIVILADDKYYVGTKDRSEDRKISGSIAGIAGIGGQTGIAENRGELRWITDS